MITVLHLSQTDINSDSRILKEISSIAKNTIKVVGLGVGITPITRLATNENITIYSINLLSRKIKYIPSVIKNTLIVVEIIFRMFSKSLQVKPNIIHCHDTPVLPLGIILKMITKSKLIYDAHELESNRNGLSKFAGKLTYYIEKVLWRFIDKLVVVSPSIKSWYVENIGPKDTEIILNSPVFFDSNTRDKNYLRNKFNIPQSSKIFLYVGIFTEGRGIDLVIEAFKKNDLDSHLVFLGYGDLESFLVDTASDSMNIHLHRAVSHESVVEISRSADVGLALIENISLSDFYSLPNKLFEYAFSGIPVLASDFPDISYIVNKYNLGECTDLSSESIYNAIKKFEQSNYDYKIDTSSLHDLTWESQEIKLNLIYQNLINVIGDSK